VRRRKNRQQITGSVAIERAGHRTRGGIRFTCGAAWRRGVAGPRMRQLRSVSNFEHRGRVFKELVHQLERQAASTTFCERVSDRAKTTGKLTPGSLARRWRCACLAPRMIFSASAVTAEQQYEPLVHFSRPPGRVALHRTLGMFALMKNGYRVCASCGDLSRSLRCLLLLVGTLFLTSLMPLIVDQV